MVIVYCTIQIRVDHHHVIIVLICMTRVVLTQARQLCSEKNAQIVGKRLKM